VPGYIIVQLIGASLAALVLRAVINVSAVHGSNYVASGYSAGAGFWMELLLTFGLVSVILGTASGAQNIGIIAALAVGAYIALAGLWGSPISGASMNPARTFGPDLIGGKFTDYWVYIAGPILGGAVARSRSRSCSVVRAVASPDRPRPRAPSTPRPRNGDRTE
jgi:aquaporin Z